MLVGVAGAVAIGAFAEAGTVAMLFSVSNWLEARAAAQTRAAIQSLAAIAPAQATRVTPTGPVVIAAEEVTLGDRLLVRPGERIPADGKIVEGESEVNQASLTGESMPVFKRVGDEVLAGTINGAGALEIEATVAAKDTTIARVIHMVEEAQAARAPVQDFIDQFARWYTPGVLVAAVALATIAPLFFAQPWYPWIYRALSLIVMACPCALVVSTPVALVAAIGAAAKNGVLVKGGMYLELAAKTQAVALDKTGTLTRGHPEVKAVHGAPGVTPEAVLALAASVDESSEHPLAEAIVAHAKAQNLTWPDSADFFAVMGKGAEAVVNGVDCAVGAPEWAASRGTDISALQGAIDLERAEGRTVVAVVEHGVAKGVISLADAIRPESVAAVKELHAIGVKHVAMLTGDHPAAAASIARECGIDDVRAGLMPDDKLNIVKALKATHGNLVMVGDGVNDAPALAEATYGISMGAAGSGVALETADIALMGDDLSKLPFLIRLGRKTMAIINQNIAFALGVKVLALVAVLPGWLTLWLAVLSDMGATFIVTLNALRLLAVQEGAMVAAVATAAGAGAAKLGGHGHTHAHKHVPAAAAHDHAHSHDHGHVHGPGCNHDHAPMPAAHVHGPGCSHDHGHDHHDHGHPKA
jgi:Cd2+/Zn2+-exporting ATPase